MLRRLFGKPAEVQIRHLKRHSPEKRRNEPGSALVGRSDNANVDTIYILKMRASFESLAYTYDGLH